MQMEMWHVGSGVRHVARQNIWWRGLGYLAYGRVVHCLLYTGYGVRMCPAASKCLPPQPPGNLAARTMVLQVMRCAAPRLIPGRLCGSVSA